MTERTAHGAGFPSRASGTPLQTENRLNETKTIAAMMAPRSSIENGAVPLWHLARLEPPWFAAFRRN
jgi:hypothetical protein